MKKHEYLKGKLIEVWRLSNDKYANPRYILKIDTGDHVLNLYTKFAHSANCPLGAYVEYEFCGRGLKTQGRYYQGGKLAYFVDRRGHVWDYRINY